MSAANSALALAGLLAAVDAIAGPVADRARSDEAWGAAYRAVVVELGGAWKRGTSDELASRSGLDAGDVAIAWRYLPSYPADDLRVAQVLARYPHYDASAVASDFRRLETLGLLAQTGPGGWRATPKADAFYGAWQEIAARRAQRAARASDADFAPLIAALDAVVAAAARLQDGGVNDSIRWRLDHRYRVAAGSPVLLRIDERVWDFIAFVNDNAHYRYDRYRRAQGTATPLASLSPLAQELFAAMRSGREYAAATCAEQAVWRVGAGACESALQELRAIGWSESADGLRFRHSSAGAAVFEAMEELTDARLYGPWDALEPSAYHSFMTLVGRMPQIADAIAGAMAP